MVKKSHFAAFSLCRITCDQWKQSSFQGYKDYFAAFNRSTKMHAPFRENHHLCKQSNQSLEPKIRSKSQCLVILLYKEINISNLVYPVTVEGVLSLVSVQNCYLLNLSFNSVYRTNNRPEQHLDGSCRNIAIRDSLKHVLASILLELTSELVNNQILTILEAESSKITESRTTCQKDALLMICIPHATACHTPFKEWISSF